jgi:hypothetical protein
LNVSVGNHPIYTKTRCFEPFPFPTSTEPQRERIRFLGEQLDAHRKRRQEAYPNLTMTEMYNVLEELRSGETLSPASQAIHDRGLVSVLRELHDELDQAVAEAYGWPAEISTEEILFRLVELNAARAAEERSGLIRWIRPEFQKSAETQTGLGVEMARLVGTDGMRRLAHLRTAVSCGTHSEAVQRRSQP